MAPNGPLAQILYSWLFLQLQLQLQFLRSSVRYNVAAMCVSHSGLS
jgi:hypothetical protein